MQSHSFAGRQDQAQTKDCKKVCLPHQRRISKYFPLLLKKIKHSTHKPTMQNPDAYRPDNWTTHKEEHAYNISLA